MNQFSRNLLTFGRRGQEILHKSSVMVLGLGGVGSFAVEALARSGVGQLVLIDKDRVDITNINRQLQATLHTIGELKCDLLKKRIHTINPECEVITYPVFFDHDTYEEILETKVDYIIDASDTITYKILLIKECLNRQIPFISVMGAAHKLDPTQLKIMNLWDTTYDPVAKVIRTKLRKEKVKGKIPVVSSTEPPIIAKYDEYDGERSNKTMKSQYPPASNAFVPPTAGLIAASYVVRMLLQDIPIPRKQSVSNGCL